MFHRDIFASRLKTLRTTVGQCGSDISLAVGLKSRSSIAQFETCRTAPSADILIALADYFGVSLDYLVGRSDDPRREEYEPIRLQKERAKIIAKETKFLDTLPESLLPAYNEAKGKNPENLKEIIDTFTKMAKDYYSLTK